MREPVLGVAEHTFTLSLSLTVDDEDGLRDMLKDGAVLELLAAVSVERHRSWWANAEIVNLGYSSILRHDPLSRDFIVTIPSPDGIDELRDRNLTRLLHNSWRKLTLRIMPVERIEAGDPDDEYILLLTVTLQHTEVPPWLEKSLIFWSSQVVPQEKRSIPILRQAE